MKNLAGQEATKERKRNIRLSQNMNYLIIFQKQTLFKFMTMWDNVYVKIRRTSACFYMLHLHTTATELQTVWKSWKQVLFNYQCKKPVEIKHGRFISCRQILLSFSPFVTFDPLQPVPSYCFPISFKVEKQRKTSIVLQRPTTRPVIQKCR